MHYWIETRGVCAYCGGSAKHYDCDGEGCEDCTAGICPQCDAGRETWLFFTTGNGKRGSCLTRDEIVAYRMNETLPDWWATYHGISQKEM